MTTFEIIGDREVIQSLQNGDQTIKRRSTRLLDSLGNWTTGRVKAYTMDAGSVDLGELVQGIHHTTKSRFGTVETTIKPSPTADKYAAFVEYGTKPHFPPISAIQGWADRHGIPAWAVAMSIAKKGTAPRYMWRNAFNDLQGHADREIQAFAALLTKDL